MPGKIQSAVDGITKAATKAIKFYDPEMGSFARENLKREREARGKMMANTIMGGPANGTIG